MSFAAPVLLSALALLAPVLLAFLVRRRRDLLRVPSTLLWRFAGVPAARNRRLRNLRRLLSLLACLVGVAALVLAAARPAGKARGETVAFVVDVSASMLADGRSSSEPWRGSPLERARRFAADRVHAGGAGDRYAILAAGAVPLRLAGLAAPGPELDAALGALAARRSAPPALAEHGRADIEAAVSLAAALVAREPGARIVVLSDGGESTGGLVSVRDVPLTQRTFAPRARDNLGIAAFATRPSPDGGSDQREAIVTVATSSTRARRASLVVTADGHEIVRRSVEVPASGEAEVRLRVLASIAKLEAAVAPDDGVGDALASDDRAVLAGAARPPPRVLLLQGSDRDDTAAFFAEKALAAAGVTQIVHTNPALDGTPPAPGDVVVALSDGPLHALSTPALYLGTRTGALPFGAQRDLGRQDTHLRSLDGRDPLLRGVVLDGVTIEHATAVAPPSGARALVDLDGGAVVLAGGVGERAFVYLGVDPARSDLVLRVAFPVLVANALQALAGAADVVVADTVARSEIQLTAAPEASAAPEEADEGPLHAGLHRPASLLVLLAAVLLALEAWAFLKGWSV
jgi:hypothetical protein